MATIPSGIWPIDPTVTSGTELAQYLNDWVQAFSSQHANATRPPMISRGGVWAKTLGAADIALMLYDGTTDFEIGKIVGGNASFGGGTNAGTTAPASPAVGDMWFDTGTSQLKIYDGANWNTVHDMTPITLDTVNNRVGINQATPTKALDVTGDASITGNFSVATDSFSVDAVNARAGIGVTSFNHMFELHGPGGTQVLYDSDATANGSHDARLLAFSVGTGFWNNLAFAGVDIKFETYTQERVRIASNGNLLVGTQAPNSTDSDSFTFQPADKYAVFNHQSGTPSPTKYIYFSYAGVPVGSIDQNGTTGINYNTSSDYRLKEDVQPMLNAIDRVKDLKPVNFAWKADGRRVDGFLAHEAQAVVPEAVSGVKDAVDEDGNPEYQGIDQSKLVPLLTAALQEALSKIDALEINMAKLMKRK